MTLRLGDVLANRFVVCGDEEAVHNARRAFRDARRPRRPRGDVPVPLAGVRNTALPAVHDSERGELELLTNPDLWLRGVDRTTGASVLIEPRERPSDRSADWLGEMKREIGARVVASCAPPFVVDVLHVGPGVVYAEPPLATPRGTFTRAEAAELALQACEAAARLHAAGIAGLKVDPWNLRVSGTGGYSRVHWLVPGSAMQQTSPSIFLGTGIANMEELDRWVGNGLDLDVCLDMCGIIDFFFSLRSMNSRSLKDDAEEVALVHMLMGAGGSELPSVAGLARSLLSLVPASADTTNRVAALPVVTAAPRLCFDFDWDDVIADGEAELARVDGDRDFIGYPLAAAYHQRACRAWAAGDRIAALHDTERALALDGNFLRYMNTHAVMLDGLGRSEEARRVLDEATVQLEMWTAELKVQTSWTGDSSVRTEIARTHAARGAISLHLGEPAQAASDLRRAMDLHPCGLYAHILGAALYSLGDFEAAAEAEARSVELAPNIARYRWALVGTLRKLGREHAAQTHAELIVAMEPDNVSHKERLAALRSLTAHAR